MQAWWESLSPLLRVLYCIAIPSTLVLVLQLVMAMLGGHSDAGIDGSDTSGLDMDSDMMADLDGNGIPDILETPDAGVHFTDGGNPADFGNLRFLTLQTVVTFLASFSWVAIIFVSSGMFVPLAVGIGAGCGLVMMLLVAKMVQMSRKLAENGAINLRNAIGETATVYVPVPAKGDGTGKITMQLQGRFGEFDAVSADNTTHGSGAQVLVTDVVGDTLVVEAAE
ncbi:MAG: NfeD family protein [Oscillospiraceae bacterium]|nr:NfeD family protein [Oscillospiraceae bacterium]